MRIALLAGVALLAAACGEKPATDGASAPASTETASSEASGAPASATCFEHSAPPAAGAKASDIAAFTKYVPWNKAHPDAKSTPSNSGVQYVVLASGPDFGAPPKADQSAEVFYEGRFNKCGPAFDSAFERNASATFPVRGVVPGFSEALQLMKPGDHWLVYIPSALGYGPSGKGPIPPDTDLIFEIEMVAAR